MGFHKRHIDNDQVIDMFNRGGVSEIRSWYLGKVDALITETGLASFISDILTDPEWVQMGMANQDDEISRKIKKYLGTVELKK
tara:strand:- start:126 stop:374 length:249 start_codon:yes stop_codon:yes gene_type:complete